MPEGKRTGTAKAPVSTNGWGNGRASGEEVAFSGKGGPDLNGFLARPNFSAASGAGRNGVVLSHGFPGASQKAGSPSSGFPELAIRLAAETGAVVLTFDFRGTGLSAGEFSLSGWQSDLAAGISTLRAVPGIERTWLVGFAAGGTLSICAAGKDVSIAGVAAFSPLSDFAERGGEARRSSAQAKAAAEAARTRGYPPEPGAWARAAKEVRPSLLVANIPPRPLLIVHGANDDVVPITDARELADAADASCELRILAGAGHGLVHDPRAIALLLGWFDRHLGSAV
jgi:dipeptidyl aminopeptidase/acylaminoacyl peptidase